jgi:uncharacterized low-complexity protein
MKFTATASALVIGSVFSVSLLSSPMSNASDNPFSSQPGGGASVVLTQAKCGEGKCGRGNGGPGRCGMLRMDADSDGKVTRDEFMQGHEAMFEEIDQNGDGVIDQSERDAHMGQMRGHMRGGKCGGGKCGASQ